MSENGWFKASRTQGAIELIKMNHNAFILLYIIATRARIDDSFNAQELKRGEAFLGDHKNYGMSLRSYRTAKQILEKHKFATFKPTSKGTIATLINTGVFNPLNEQTDNQTDKQPTNSRQATDKQPTTNKNYKNENNEKNETTTEENFVVAAVECNIPSQAEVTEYGLKNGCSQELCKRFFEYYEGNNRWLNQHGRLIKWTLKLIQWRDDPKSASIQPNKTNLMDDIARKEGIIQRLNSQHPNGNKPQWVVDEIAKQEGLIAKLRSQI